jgi:5-methylcytosine-specific restriction endonuclease McrA
MGGTIDHVIPQAYWLRLMRSARGLHAEANLQAAHRRCNVAKGDTIEAVPVRFAAAFAHINKMLWAA